MNILGQILGGVVDTTTEASRAATAAQEGFYLIAGELLGIIVLLTVIAFKRK